MLLHIPFVKLFIIPTPVLFFKIYYFLLRKASKFKAKRIYYASRAFYVGKYRNTSNICQDTSFYSKQIVGLLKPT